ncbi:hypothetical protein [Carnobacterium maltaromaticum]|uniref:hypothetical protein n=1 Tax=Carnobacterium maltaromaticum TaxID=2751 RepID=UPI0039B01391
MNELSVKKDREILIINFLKEISSSRFSKILMKYGFVEKQEKENVFNNSKGNTIVINDDSIRIVISEESDITGNLIFAIINDLNECDFVSDITDLGYGVHTLVTIKTDTDRILVNEYLNILPYYDFKNIKIDGVNEFNVELNFKDDENNTRIYTSVETLNREYNDFIVFIGIDKDISDDSSFIDTFNDIQNLYPYYIDEIINKGVDQNE